jgi:hypothetical protein
MGWKGIHTEFLRERQKERDHLDDINVCRRILKWILEVMEGAVTNGLIWLRIRISGLLCTQHSTFGFHKMLENSRVTEGRLLK